MRMIVDSGNRLFVDSGIRLFVDTGNCPYQQLVCVDMGNCLFAWIWAIAHIYRKQNPKTIEINSSGASACTQCPAVSMVSN